MPAPSERLGAYIDVDLRPDSVKLVVDGQSLNPDHIRDLTLTVTNDEPAIVTCKFYVDDVRWVTETGDVLTKRAGQHSTIFSGPDAEVRAAAEADVMAEADRREGKR